MKKQARPPGDLGGREPLHVFVERFKDKPVEVHGDMSKRSLRALLVSSLMVIPKHQAKALNKLHLESENLEAAIRTLSDIYGDTAGKGKREVEKFAADVRSDAVKRTGKKVSDCTKLIVDPNNVSVDQIEPEDNKIVKQRKTERSLKSEKSKKTKRRAKTERTKRGRIKTEFTDDYDGQYPGWMHYDDRSLSGEEMVVEEEEVEEEEVESPSCPSSLTEELELSYDGKWLRRYTKVPLKLAIKEILAKKPYDPVGYLGFWLINYRNCQENQRRRLEDDQELNRLRLLFDEKVSVEEEEYLSAGEEYGETEEETRDWNFKYYDAKI